MPEGTEANNRNDGRDAGGARDRSWGEVAEAIVRMNPPASAPSLSEIESRRAGSYGVDAPAGRIGPARPGRRLVYSAAAAVLLGVSAAVVIVGTQSGAFTGGASGIADGDGSRLIDRDAERYYTMVTRRFEPQVICDTPEKFIDYTQKAFGEPLTASFDSPVTLVGWTGLDGGYDPDAPADGPRCLLALGPSGERIVVVFDDAASPAVLSDDGASVRTFTQRFGSLAAYEVTPLEESVVLGLLSPAVVAP
ncbi:MAG: hypothetical protein AAF297_10750 [Planctomycetota bacterium]